MPKYRSSLEAKPNNGMYVHSFLTKAFFAVSQNRKTTKTGPPNQTKQRALRPNLSHVYHHAIIHRPRFPLQPILCSDQLCAGNHPESHPRKGGNGGNSENPVFQQQEGGIQASSKRELNSAKSKNWPMGG